MFGPLGFVRRGLMADVDGLATYRRHPNVVLTRTFSKAYGLAGFRVGYAVAHAQVALDQFLEAVHIAHGEQHGREDVGERGAGRAGHAAGDVGHAIVHHTVLLENRIGVRGDFAGLEAAAAVDAHIDDHAAVLHLLHHLLRHHHGRAALLGA